MIFTSTAELKNIKTGDGFMTGEWAGTESLLGHLGGGGLVSEFQGLGNLLEFLPENMPIAKHEKASDRAKSSYPDFYVFNDYKQALDTFRLNPSKVRDFTENDVPLKGGDAGGLRLEYDTTGDMLDVGRYLDGEPEVFSSLTDGVPRGRRVRIIVNLSAGAMTEPKVILERQKRLVRLVDWLESQSIRVEIIAVVSHDCGHTEIVIKQYSDPLDLNDVAVVAHTDFLRRIHFRVLEYSKTWSDGYGNSRSFQEYIESNPTSIKSENMSETTIYIGCRYERNDVKGSFDLLENTLEKSFAEPPTEPEVLTVMS